MKLVPFTLSLLGVAFIVMKVASVIAWPWIAVLAPLLAIPVWMFGPVAIVFLAGLYLWLLQKNPAVTIPATAFIFIITLILIGANT